MGEMVSFASNGGTATGYLATPARGKGAGARQSWSSRSGGASTPRSRRSRTASPRPGYVALAPDLYHGKIDGRAGRGAARS